VEQAFRYREELGPLDERARALAAHGGWLLAVAAERAQSRGDLLAAENLFERALALLPDETPERLELLCDPGRALIQIGSLARAEEVLTEAIESAEAIGDRRVRSNALVSRAALRIYTQPDLEHGTEELMQVTEEAVRVFEECGDHLGLARAWSKLAEVHWSRCQYAAMEEVLERALNHARKAGDDLECAIILNGLARAAVLGPTPVEAGIQRCRSILEQTRSSALEAILGLVTGWFEAMRGNFDEARALYTQSRAIFEEFGLKRWIAAYPVWAGPTELVTGDFARAESERRRGYDLLRAMGDRGTLSPVAAFLAQAVYAQGRYEEADELASVSEECASRDDRFPHVVWRGVRAKVLARRGELDEATRLAREAVALADETDSLNLQGDAWVNLAEVLRLGMSHAEA